MIENELTDLFALVGSIKANAEKIEGAENVQSLIDGITEMCEIAEEKLSLIRNETSEVKNV